MVVRVWCVKGGFTFVLLAHLLGREENVVKWLKKGGRGASQGARQINFDGTLGSFPPSYRFHVKGKCLSLELISWLYMETLESVLGIYSTSRNVRCKNPYWFFRFFFRILREMEIMSKVVIVIIKSMLWHVFILNLILIFSLNLNDAEFSVRKKEAIQIKLF